MKKKEDGDWNSVTPTGEILLAYSLGNVLSETN